jgi:hypothetical protein
MSDYATSNYFQGQGRVFIALRDTTPQPLGFTFLGNAPKVTLNLGRHAVQYATGGVQAPRNKHTAGQPPTIDIDLESITRENIATAIYGTPTAVGASSVVDEQVTMYIGKWSPLANIGVQSIAILQRIDRAFTYVEGVDYSVNRATGSILAIPGARLSDLQTILISYSYGAYDKVGAFTTAPPAVWVRFEGLNSVDASAAPIVVDIFKVRLQPIDGFALLSDTISQFSLRGRIYHDYTQPDTLTDGRMLRIRKQ